TDSGTFEAVQVAATHALTFDQACVEAQRQIYRERVDVLCDGLSAAGYEVIKPQASFYCLVVVPKGWTSLEFSAKLLREAHVVSTPAPGFGPSCEGFVRLTVCADKSRLAEAVKRLAQLK